MRWGATVAVVAAVMGVAFPSVVRAADAPPPPGPARRCATSPTGDVAVTVSSQGTTARVVVHVGSRRRAGSPVALLFNFHGSTQAGSSHRSSSGTDEAADRHGFAVAYPDGGVPTTPVGLGLPAGYFWNIPGVPLVGGLPVPPGSRDDVRFVADAIDAIDRAVCVDRRRVYATGASGGGRMASLLGCALADRVAAIAPVMGVRAGNPDPDDPSRPDPATCRPSRPMPVIAFHGEQDTVDPYHGGGPAYWGYSVPVAMARWAQLDGCARREPDRRVTATVFLMSWSGCRAGSDVRLYRSTTAGHTWPGREESAIAPAVLGEVDLTMDANDVMWRLLSRHHLP